MIEARDVSYCYAGGSTPALDHVSVEFSREKISAVVGESGSGKTTLMMCIGRFLRPAEGQILYDGKNVFDMEERDFRQHMGMVFQKLYLFPHLSIRENMTLALRRALGRGKKEAESKAESMLKHLGISEILDRYPSQISGGQAQRAAIARGLLLKPDYMLLDEPTSALDARTTDAFAEWLKKLKDQTNFIIVTHDVLFAERVADQGVCMAQGKITGQGPIEEALHSLRHDASRDS